VHFNYKVLGLLVIGKNKIMKTKKQYLTLFRTSSKEKAIAASQAITKMWPCNTNVLEAEDGWFEVYAFDPEVLNSLQKRAIPTWASGFVYAKFGE
jgi:hypothetical protein